jgi:hypothetical protein
MPVSPGDLACCRGLVLLGVLFPSPARPSLTRCSNSTAHAKRYIGVSSTSCFSVRLRGAISTSYSPSRSRHGKHILHLDAIFAYMLDLYICECRPANIEWSNFIDGEGHRSRYRMATHHVNRVSIMTNDETLISTNSCH